MGKVWVLDTATKGTGAQMVPLDKALERKRSAPGGDRISVIRRGPGSRSPETARAGEAPEPRRPHRFKVVNTVNRQVLAKGVGIREVLDLLAPLPSVVDVQVYLLQAASESEPRHWRALTLREQKRLWTLRGRRSLVLAEDHDSVDDVDAEEEDDERPPGVATAN
jgi:hypothetical protein